MTEHYIQLRCSACGRREVVGPAQMLERLRTFGMLKREKEPAQELVRALFEARLSSLRCATCDHIGLALEPLADWDDDQWGGARNCDTCGQPISAERLEVFPDTRCCVHCQQSQDQGLVDQEPEFCPRCGSTMDIRLDPSSGISRYVMFCSSCGKRC